MKKTPILLAAVLCILAAASCKRVPEEDSSAFVTLTSAVPDAILEIRYFSTYNFVGGRIDGYLQPVALMTRKAPDVPDTLMKPYFYPDLDKGVLFEQEYIMARSGHSRGSTVDLTLFDMATEKEVDMGGTFDWFGPESQPDFCGNPDTGEYTGDNSSRPRGRSISEEQFRNRMILRQVMLRHGFRPLDTEWWDFTLCDEPFPDTFFTFPVRQLD